ncbi:MAG: ATP-dependent Clp protease proteolytic subunit [Planctomycetota bacterium]
MQSSYDIWNASKDKDDDKKDKPAPIERDMLEKHRTIFISEEVSSKLSKRIIPQLLWLDAQSDDPIRLFINTPGGSADDGFGIFDVLRYIRSPVNAICTGLNASAGTIILLATPKERRFSLPNTRIMIHQPAGGGRGKASDLQITAEEILKLRKRANELIAEECGQPFDKVERDTNRDCWLSPEEALEYGLIGKILTSLNDL